MPHSGDTAGDDSYSAATVGRFESLGVLGRGGMGVVLRARDPELNRPVALKLLAPGKWSGTADSLGESRLQREAQAMAKLSHPNVVTVYEMGRIGHDSFIAMELIEGETLRGWLNVKPRSWRTIVEIFVACGRGLAAAHAVALVHRDFKPENVLVDKQDRPRVSDFGLVATGIVTNPEDLPASTEFDRISKELTVRGAIVGTPAYMAPEQWAGLEVDARTDQFAFCVALWEALHGQRPFTGDVGGILRANVLVGKISEPPPPATPPDVSARAQHRIDAALRRGLAVDRDARWPSLDVLLAELERAVAVQRKGPILAVAATALLVGGGALGLSHWMQKRTPTCSDPTPDLAGKWDAAIASSIAAKFAATGLPFAASEWQTVQASLDSYAKRWATGSLEACRDTHERKTQSPALLDQRQACLQRGKLGLLALARTFNAIDRDGVSEARTAAAHLPDLAACDNADRLTALVARPTDPSLRREIEAVEAMLADVGVARKRGVDPTAIAQLDAAIAAARKTAYAPLIANALYLQGEIAQERRDPKRSEVAFREAAALAADGKDDELAADAWMGVLMSVGDQRDNVEAARALVPVADAAIRRAGDSPRLRFHYYSVVGAAEAQSGQLDDAYKHFVAAREVAGGDPVWRATIAVDLATVTWQREGEAKALPLAVDATALAQAAWGEHHPKYAQAVMLHSQLLDNLGKSAESKVLIETAIAIYEGAFGRKSIPVADALLSVGNVRRNLGAMKEAQAAYEESIAINAALDAQASSRALPMIGLAQLYIETAQPELAIPQLDIALPLLASSAGKDSFDYGLAQYFKAAALVDADRCSDAEPLLTNIIEATKLPFQTGGWLLRGRCVAQQKKWREAEPIFAKGLALCKDIGCEPDITGALTFYRGQALVESGQDRVGGAQLAKQGYDTVLPADANGARRMEPWLRARTLL